MVKGCLIDSSLTWAEHGRDVEESVGAFAFVFLLRSRVFVGLRSVVLLRSQILDNNFDKEALLTKTLPTGHCTLAISRDDTKRLGTDALRPSDVESIIRLGANDLA